MVVTPLMWASWDRYKSLNQHLWLTPIEWNIAKRRLEYHPISKMLIPYLTISFFLLPFHIFCCLSLLFFQLYGSLRMSWLDVSRAGGMLAMATTTLAYESLYLFKGENMVRMANNIITLDQSLCSYGKTHKI